LTSWKSISFSRRAPVRGLS